MIINDRSIVRRMEPIDASDQYLVTAIHEITHALLEPRLFFPRPDTPPAPISRSRTRLADIDAASATAARPSVIDFNTEYPWHNHGIDFIRAHLHLWYRTQQVIDRVLPPAHCAGTEYGLSHPRVYLQSLGDEPERFRGYDLAASLKAHDAPLPFLQQFCDDVAAHRRRLSLTRETNQ